MNMLLPCAAACRLAAVRLAIALPALAFGAAALPALPAHGQGPGVQAPGAPGVGAASQAKATTPADPGWPRTFTKDDATVVVYQPQVDAWQNYSAITFRAAVAVTLAGAKDSTVGVVACTADTIADREAGVVLMSNLKLTPSFPSVPAATAATLGAIVQDAIGSRPVIQLSLERVLAYMHSAPKPAGVELNLAPPPIYYSDAPAIMVIYMGQPDFKPVTPGDMSLMFAVNTNWVVLLDGASGQYYLLDGSTWLTAPDPVNGPWTAAQSTPASFRSLPKTGDWPAVAKYVPGTPTTTPPKVFVSTEPAELIVTDGPPNYSPIAGTRLMYVSNPALPVFYDMANGQTYYLSAGRWFSAPGLQGPWTAASANLPSDFAAIPHTSPMGWVLQSVPGTTEAADAVLLAQVPHKATVTIATTTVNVTYDGAPAFAPIAGTPMTYATNTTYQVLQAEGKYYCCFGGVWFVSNAATGPWTVATAVPKVIYTIPPSNPLYNTTYVTVYDSTPTTVVVGYTSGYSGSYVATTGVLMFGAGMLTGALIASNNCWYPCCPAYYSYGCSGWYHYGCGGYATGCSWYGPNGGAGWGAGYNPSTGTWSRSGYAYGPYGEAHGTQAYNPWTNTWAGHAGGSTGYRSWGASSVSNGSQWAEAAHTTGPGGVSHGWAETSSGAWARGATTGNGTGAAVASNGDVYAGHDGNAYRRTSDGQWQSYGNGGWNDVNTPSRTANNGASTTAQSRASQYSAQTSLNTDSWARNQGDRGSWGGDNSWNRSSSGWGGDGGWGGRSSAGAGSSGSSWGSRSSSWGGSSGGWRGGGGFGGFRGRR